MAHSTSRPAPRAAYALGIDFGTTHTVAAAYALHDGAPTPAAGPLNLGEHGAMASCVSFDAEDARTLVGKAARARAFVDPSGTIYGIKRQLPNAQWSRVAFNRLYKPEDVVALILSEARQRIERELGEPVVEAVLTVPAHFGVRERVRMIDAARQAGLNVRTLLSEPVAAALAYGWNMTQQRTRTTGPQRVLVYDLGGGTFDAALLDLDGDEINELGVTGSIDIGGDRFTELFAAEIAKRASAQLGFNLAQANAPAGVAPEVWRRAQQRAFELAERAMIALSSETSTRVHEADLLPGFGGANGQPLSIDLTIQRAEFEAVVGGDVARTVALCESLAAHAAGAVNRVLLVGNASAIPAVRDRLRAAFGVEPETFEPATSVARGAALYHAVLLGAADGADDAIRESYRPTTPAMPYATPGAYAAARAALRDTRAFADHMPAPMRVNQCAGANVGVCTVMVDTSGRVVDDANFDVVIPRGTALPTRVDRVFMNAYDNQTHVQFLVFEGDARDAVANALLGECMIGPLPPMPRGGAVYDVAFELDENKTLTLTARERARPETLHRLRLQAVNS